jgi:ElaB/YqjD/DUF883 family membrane-anchored ribosome-binding protein
MKLVRTLSMIIALAGASTALADTPTKAPAPTEKKAPEFTKAEVNKAEKFFDDFYNAVVKNQDACPKMATAINTLLDKNEAWLKKMAESGKDMPQSSKDKMQKKMQEMSTAMMKCKDDKGVQASMQRFMTIAASKKAEPAPPPAKK